jgi:hypothetical protein
VKLPDGTEHYKKMIITVYNQQLENISKINFIYFKCFIKSWKSFYGYFFLVCICYL